MSAFRDKLERYHDKTNYTEDYYFNLFGRDIVTSHRKAALERFGESFFSRDNNFGTPVMPESGKRTPEMPTFWEFVQFLKKADPARLDMHWKPMSLFCAPCLIKYGFVASFEGLANGHEAVCLERALEGPGNRRSKIDHSKQHHVMGGNQVRIRRKATFLQLTILLFLQESLTEKYFSLLDEQDVKDLYRIYRDDFMMFGYDQDYRKGPAKRYI